MYINPFVAGVLTTILVELLLVVAYSIYIMRGGKK